MSPSTPPRTDSRDRSGAIVAAARRVAESEGWPAVTVRRLAAEIGFSQPILYRCFPRGRDEIVEQVMIEGFAAMGAELEDPSGADPLAHLVRAYLAFARSRPALYEAMFEARTRIVFASDETPAPLRDAFGPFLCAASAEGGDERTAVVRAELLWSLLHGVAQLAASGRLDPALEAARLDAIVGLFRS
ncbi:TetR-like C-terminal domain-containing protein [Microbacterium capsulatum]|uniref:TetR-like C-terminal domain-containing protein n=1 Tax=Microbacterium capsulatum TaxID=3041921 RepID=A0ABU0XG20_9MICO|nr:TetR-like C-terminal domain-containing protein [Microbacterium sp. ASV81]MDQ4213543.1 TetR-like C-terminal domain-containing protein [Microbacterium sp. ASV81]